MTATTSSPPRYRPAPPSWFEDPHFSLESLTPGQRYTALLVLVLTVLMVTIGVPRGTSSAAPPYVPGAGATATNVAGAPSSPASVPASSSLVITPGAAATPLPASPLPAASTSLAPAGTAAVTGPAASPATASPGTAAPGAVSPAGAASPAHPSGSSPSPSPAPPASSGGSGSGSSCPTSGLPAPLAQLGCSAP